MTPGRLAKCGVFVIAGWIALALIASLLAISPHVPHSFVEKLLFTGLAIGGIGGLLLLAAGVAKVIQIGVQSTND